MKIDPKVLSIPPYISTSWKNVESLHLETQAPILILVVTLMNGTRIEIPHLEPSAIESAFEIHAQHLQKELTPQQSAPTSSTPVSFLLEMQKTGLKLPTQMPFGLDHFGSILEHNPEQAELPDLPPELLRRVASLSKTIGIEDPTVLPEAQFNCNCLYCQIARALRSGLSIQEEPEEEVVSEEDLKFRSWDINQTNDKLYVVANPLDAQEQYSVYLGEPVGCTCGQKHCEHIEAVLNS